MGCGPTRIAKDRTIFCSGDEAERFEVAQERQRPQMNSLDEVCCRLGLSVPTPQQSQFADEFRKATGRNLWDTRVFPALSNAVAGYQYADAVRKYGDPYLAQGEQPPDLDLNLFPEASSPAVGGKRGWARLAFTQELCARKWTWPAIGNALGALGLEALQPNQFDNLRKQAENEHGLAQPEPLTPASSNTWHVPGDDNDAE